MYKIISSFFILLLSINGFAQPIPQMSAIPDHFDAQQKKTFSQTESQLLEKKSALRSKIGLFNTKCAAVSVTIQKELITQCEAEQAEIRKMKLALIDGILTFNKDIITQSDEYFAIKEEKEPSDAEALEKYIQHIKKSMVDLARKFKWTEEEIKRLDSALNKLYGDNTATSSQIVSSWASILQRGEDPGLKIKANGGKGPILPSAGKQSTGDCAVFALANASGRPYSEVAGIAIELIKKGEWRSEEDKKDFQKVFKNGGLMGGEVLMLTEALGQVEVIESSEFEKTISSGKNIMVNVVPYDGNKDAGHEVVITKTFKQNGETWFEMIDSNREGPWQRLYLSSKELQTILQENGVVYRPEKGTVPELLR